MNKSLPVSATYRLIAMPQPGRSRRKKKRCNGGTKKSHRGKQQLSILKAMHPRCWKETILDENRPAKGAGCCKPKHFSACLPNKDCRENEVTGSHNNWHSQTTCHLDQKKSTIYIYWSAGHIRSTHLQDESRGHCYRRSLGTLYRLTVTTGNCLGPQCNLWRCLDGRRVDLITSHSRHKATPNKPRPTSHHHSVTSLSVCTQCRPKLTFSLSY